MTCSLMASAMDWSPRLLAPSIRSAAYMFIVSRAYATRAVRHRAYCLASFANTAARHSLHRLSLTQRGVGLDGLKHIGSVY